MAHPSKDAIVAMLRDVARQIQGLDDGDIEDVLVGKAKLHVEIQGLRRPAKAKGDALPNDALEKIAGQLRALSSREEGQRLLESLASKDELVRLSRHLDLPAQKRESAEQLKSRLIESTIGFRLRSAAIQGGAPKTPDKAIEPVEGGSRVDPPSPGPGADEDEPKGGGSRSSS